MEDEATVGEQRVRRLEVPNIKSLERKVCVPRMMRQVPFVPTHQIIDYADTVSVLEQAIDHVATNKARTAGDNGNRPTHATFRCFIVFTLK